MRPKSASRFLLAAPAGSSPERLTESYRKSVKSCTLIKSKVNPALLHSSPVAHCFPGRCQFPRSADCIKQLQLAKQVSMLTSMQHRTKSPNVECLTYCGKQQNMILSSCAFPCFRKRPTFLIASCCVPLKVSSCGPKPIDCYT